MKSIKKKNEEQTDGFKLSVYLMAARSLYPDVKGYEELAEIVNREFGIEVTGRDIWVLEEPTIEQEELDYELIYEKI